MAQPAPLSAFALLLQADAFYDRFPRRLTADQLLTTAAMYDSAACAARVESDADLCRDAELGAEACRMSVHKPKDQARHISAQVAA